MYSIQRYLSRHPAPTVHNTKLDVQNPRCPVIAASYIGGHPQLCVKSSLMPIVCVLNTVTRYMCMIHMYLVMLQVDTIHMYVANYLNNNIIINILHTQV